MGVSGAAGLSGTSPGIMRPKPNLTTVCRTSPPVFQWNLGRSPECRARKPHTQNNSRGPHTHNTSRTSRTPKPILRPPFQHLLCEVHRGGTTHLVGATFLWQYRPICAAARTPGRRSMEQSTFAKSYQISCGPCTAHTLFGTVWALLHSWCKNRQSSTERLRF